jgi:hypothetical protein
MRACRQRAAVGAGWQDGVGLAYTGGRRLLWTSERAHIAGECVCRGLEAKVEVEVEVGRNPIEALLASVLSGMMQLHPYPSRTDSTCECAGD